MSVSAAALSGEEYEDRRRLLEEMKLLMKSEQGEIYRIVKQSRAEFSKNSNGVFFDICKLPAETFSAIQKFMEFSRKNRESFAIREEEQRKAEEALRSY